MRYALIRMSFALLTALCAHSAFAGDTSSAKGAFSDRVAALENQAGGRLGVALLDTGTGRQWDYRGDDRFAMCSTFKVLLAAAVLKQVEQGRLSLDQNIDYGPEDLQGYGPITRDHVKAGEMTVAGLAAAAVEYSDNTAANLLLARVGGPAGVTRFAYDLGDPVTRLDRNEPTLNTNIAGDKRDTSTPKAMAATLRKLLVGEALGASSRHRLIDWMVNSKTGDHRIRAGLDPKWVVGDKTGTGERGAANDVAIIWPPKQPPLILVIYYSNAGIAPAKRDAVIASVARLMPGRTTPSP